MPPPPPYCFPLRPRFCGPCPPIFPSPPSPIIIMPPSHPPPAPPCWPCPMPLKIKCSCPCPRFPIASSPQMGSGGQNEKHPYYNNCNFYGPGFGNTDEPNNKSLFSAGNSICSSDLPNSPMKSPPSARPKLSVHPEKDMPWNSERVTKGGRDTATTNNMQSFWGGGNHPTHHGDLWSRSMEGKPKTPFSYGSTCRRRRKLPGTATSNDSISFAINRGEMTRGRFPRTIRIETVEPEPQSPPPPIPLVLPPRRHYRGHHHKRRHGRKRKHGINNSCKKCIEKFIDEQVCRRLEEICIPDPCWCEPQTGLEETSIQRRTNNSNNKNHDDNNGYNHC